MRQAPNPIRRYKDRHKLTYQKLAEVLGISEDYAKKLGSGGLRSVSIAKAEEFARRTGGEISFSALIRWMREGAAA
jgi:transcriptional regulator with XRE-family HTH domain